MNRRDFVTQSSMFSAGAMFIPHLKQFSSADKLNLAFIGVGGRGGRNIKGCAQFSKAGVSAHNIVALCDVDDNRAAKMYASYPSVKRFRDFRKMFDAMANEIDAVVISTPDHTHFPATMAAMQLGKHVYVEKPLAHNVWELRTLKKAQAHYGLVTQMGNQGHTTDGIRKIKEWYDAGVLGQVREVIAWFNGPKFSNKGYFNHPDVYPPKGEAVPDHLDWDSWLGPRLDRPYSHYYLPKWWRGWHDFGNAELGDWCCHTLDAPFWTLELGMPASVDSVFRVPEPQGRDFISNQSQLQFNFPQRGDKAPVRLNWFEGGIRPVNRPEWGLESLPKSGMIMVGDKASLMTGGRPNKPQLIGDPDMVASFHKNMPTQSIPRVGEEDPQGEFVNAIIGKGPKTGSPFSYGADLTEMALIGVLAQRFHKRIEYDAVNMKVTNHDHMDQYIKEPVREGWSYGEELW